MDKKILHSLAAGATKIVTEHNKGMMPNMKMEDIVKILKPHDKHLVITKEVDDKKTETLTSGAKVEFGRIALEFEGEKAYIPTEGSIEFGPDFTIKPKEGEIAPGAIELFFRPATNEDRGNKAMLEKNGCVYKKEKVAETAEKKTDVDTEPAKGEVDLSKQEPVAETTEVETEVAKTETIAETETVAAEPAINATDAIDQVKAERRNRKGGKK